MAKRRSNREKNPVIEQQSLDIPEPNDTVSEEDLEALAEQVVDIDFDIEEISPNNIEVIQKEKKKKEKDDSKSKKSETGKKAKEPNKPKANKKENKEAINDSITQLNQDMSVSTNGTEQTSINQPKVLSTEEMVQMKEQQRIEAVAKKRGKQPSVALSSSKDPKDKRVRKTENKKENYNSFLDKMISLAAVCVTFYGVANLLTSLYIILWLGQPSETVRYILVSCVGLFVLYVLIRAERLDDVWQDFSQNISKLFKKLRNDEE